jgi:hypothetical protein
MKHYRVKELAQEWSCSANTIIRHFRNEPDVINVSQGAAGKRPYASLRIPESAVIRVRERLGQKTLQATLPRRHPLRVIKLGDTHRRMPQKARHIIDTEAVDKPADSEGVA